jgi:hypothetical protein
MTKDDIMRMAREAGPLMSTPFDVWCERFAERVAAAERMACLDICTAEANAWKSGKYPFAEASVNHCANHIRARGER